jgi:hypothetical protein
VAVDAQMNPVAFTSDTMINGSLNWQPANPGLLKEITSVFGTGVSFTGNWIDATDRFLGIRFKDNDTMKYGWIEMVMNTNQVTVVTTILDYAYENSGAGILTQDSLGAIGISDVFAESDLAIFSYQNRVVVKVNDQLSSQLHISVIDILGRRVKDITTRAHEVDIDLSSFTGKALVITAEQDNRIVRKKILVM